MTEHLPECLNDDDTYGWRRWCICEELRACEQRVLDEGADDLTITRGVNYAHGYADGYAKGRKDAYAAGIDAAREAVEAARVSASEALNPLDPRTLDIAIAAIDALKEKP